MSLDRRVQFLQDRLAYMVGLGLPVTFITSFGPPLVNMAIFALLYPIVSFHLPSPFHLHLHIYPPETLYLAVNGPSTSYCNVLL